MPTVPPENTPSTVNSTARNRWLVVGALTGALLAATGVMESGAPLEGAQIVATIDGEAVYLSQFQVYVGALQQNRSDRLSQQERDHILERIIDEKLLIRQGERSGLTRSEPTVRKAIVDAVIENIVSERAGRRAGETELRDFYQQNRSYFSHAPLFQVQRMVFRTGDTGARATAAHAALLAGQRFSEVKNQADEEVLKLPT
ncbi:MAG: SurA N-terminal domain-containing protein, partial [Halioglobus sp.]